MEEEYYDEGSGAWIEDRFPRCCILLWPLFIIYFIYISFRYIYDYKVHSPLFKFLLHLLSYLCFLALYSYFILFNLHPEKPSVYEYLVWCWIFSMWLEELRQLFDSNGSTMRLKVVSYFTSSWNAYDQVAFLLFFVAIAMRLALNNFDWVQFNWIRMVYVICFIMSILRLLQYFSVLRYFGPKIGILIRMFKDTVGYIFMFALFLSAYGISSQVLLYPNSPPSFPVLFNIVYYPYIAIFGQFDLLDEEVFSCTYQRNISQHR